MSDRWAPSDYESTEQGLSGRVARGLTWTIVDTWGKQALNLVVFIILARLLAPVDFGLVALAAVFVALAQLLVDQGLGDALIQRRDVSRTHLDTAFWVAMATGAALTLIGLLISVPAAALLGEPLLAPILQVLSLTFVLAAPVSIQTALLRRELNFRALALRTILAGICGGAAGIGLAYAGAGAWALVGQQVVAAIVSVVTLWRVSPWRPGRQISSAHFRELFSFGVNVVGSDTLTFLSRNVDNLLIGVVLGPIQLGYYAVGYRVLEVSQSLMVNVARQLTFPVFARLQDDVVRMQRAYLRVTAAASFLILPGYVGLSVAAPEFTTVLVGDRWALSGTVAAALFLIGPVLSLQAFSGAFLNAAGRPDVVLRFRLITTVTNVAGFLAAVQFGIVAVAIAFVARGYLLLPLILFWMRRYVGVPIGAQLAQVRSTGTATVAMAAVMIVAKILLDQRIPAAALLLFEIGAATVTYLGAMWLLQPALVRELLSLASHAAPRRRRREHLGAE